MSRLALVFRCQLCHSVVPPRTAGHRLVVRRRAKHYPYRSRANVIVRRPEPGKKPKKEYRDDPGGEGQEIVQELPVCPACAAKNGRP
jgi:hypothetical protein